MSLFSIPDDLLPSKKMLDEVTKQTDAPKPAEFTSTMNFMAQPLAGAAAMSALGVGFASHAFGVWFGTMTAATTASQRMFLPMFEGFGMDVADFRDPPKKPSITAKSGPQTVGGADKPKVGRLGKGAKAASDDEAAETARLALPEELVTEKPQPEPKADAPTGAHLQELSPAAELASADAPEASEAVAEHVVEVAPSSIAANSAVTEDVPATPVEETPAAALEEPVIEVAPEAAEAVAERVIEEPVSMITAEPVTEDVLATPVEETPAGRP